MIKYTFKQTLLLFIILGTLCLAIISCKPQENTATKVYRLDLLTYTYSHPNRYSECILVANPPEDRYKLDSIMHSYVVFNSNLHALDTIQMYDNKKINQYYISFYKETKCTRFYITNKENKRNVIDEEKSSYNRYGCLDDELGLFIYKRSEENDTLWYTTYPKDFKDTIYTRSLSRTIKNTQ